MTQGSDPKVPAHDLKSAIETFRALSEAFQSNIISPLVGVAVAVNELFEPIRKALDEVTPEQWAKLAQFAQNGVAEYQKHLDEEEARVVGILTTNGWLGLESRFNIHDIRKMLAVHDDGGNDAVNKFVLDFFKVDNFRLMTTMTDSWMNIPYLEKRRHVLHDALDAHKRGQFSLTVPSLLPFAEGLSSEILSKGLTYKGNAVTALAIYVKDTDKETWGQVFSDVVCETFYKSYKFGEQDAPYLNRHGILHGRTSDYASEANSLRVFLFLDVLADLWFKQAN
jgi:hypothetical protein